MATKKTEPFKLTLNDFSDEKYTKNGNVYIHPSITNLDAPIYRYMNIEYLLSMLTSKKLYVPNRSQFTDLSEKGYHSDLLGFFLPVAHNKKERDKPKPKENN